MYLGGHKSHAYLPSLPVAGVVAELFACCCRFVTKAEVERLGLNHLLGTSLMRAYMHGYFVDNRLWHKARSLAEPFAYDTYRQQRVQQKLDAERKSRIGIVKKLPKVWHCHPLHPPRLSALPLRPPLDCLLHLINPLLPTHPACHLQPEPEQ